MLLWKSLKLDNENGNLKSPRYQLSSYVDYINQGGGKWFVSVFDAVEKSSKQVASMNMAAKTEVETYNLSDENALEIAMKTLEEHNEYPITED